MLHLAAFSASIAFTNLLRTAPSLAESSVSSIQGGVGSGQGLSIEDRLNQWRLSRMQQQQQQPPVATIETTRPVLTRSRLENDSPNSSASSAASKRGIRPASGKTVHHALLNALISYLHPATPSISVAAKVPAPSRLPPPISATPRSGTALQASSLSCMPDVLSLSSSGSVQDWRLEMNANDQICFNTEHENNARQRLKAAAARPIVRLVK